MVIYIYIIELLLIFRKKVDVQLFEFKVMVFQGKEYYIEEEIGYLGKKRKKKGRIQEVIFKVFCLGF